MAKVMPNVVVRILGRLLRPVVLEALREGAIPKSAVGHYAGRLGDATTALRWGRDHLSRGAEGPRS